MDLTSNAGYVRFCFKQLLGREPSLEDERAFAAQLDSKAWSRERLLVEILQSPEYSMRTRNREAFPPGHYYSAIPSNEDRQEFLARPAAAKREIEAVALNAEQQFQLLQRFKDYYEECPFRDTPTDGLRYYYENPSYSYTDALTLYSMLRLFKPRRVIEIGSGYSSAAMLDTAERFLAGSVAFTFIEPYPDLLKSLLTSSDARHKVVPQRLQDVDTVIFRELTENDILFIDSTHVSKLGSDVNRIIFEILPILNPGVLIHFHDVFWPFEYPRDWIEKGISWNEDYMLRAFLEFNESFEILFFAGYLHTYHEEWFRQNMPLYLKNNGGNFWMRRRVERES